MSRLLVEPPGARLPVGRPPARPGDLSVGAFRIGALRVGAGAAALALVLTSSGDALLLAAILGVAAADRAVFLVAALAAVASLGRWGTTALADLAGDQAVLGWAGTTGSTTAVVSTWLATAALVVAAGGRRPALVVVPLGLMAALVVAGPAATSTTDAVVRAGASIAGVVIAGAASRWLPPRPASLGAVALAAAAAATGLLS